VVLKRSKAAFAHCVARAEIAAADLKSPECKRFSDAAAKTIDIKLPTVEMSTNRLKMSRLHLTSPDSYPQGFGASQNTIGVG
jgi:hypothetical protein